MVKYCLAWRKYSNLTTAGVPYLELLSHAIALDVRQD